MNHNKENPKRLLNRPVIRNTLPQYAEQRMPDVIDVNDNRFLPKLPEVTQADSLRGIHPYLPEKRKIKHVTSYLEKNLPVGHLPDLADRLGVGMRQNWTKPVPPKLIQIDEMDNLGQRWTGMKPSSN